MPMDNEYFQDWLAAVELAVGDDRRCPHCSTPGAVSWGKARGLRRYQGSIWVEGEIVS